MTDTARPSDLESARRRALAVCLTVFLGFCLVAVLRMIDAGTEPAHLVLGGALMVAMLGLQLFVVHRPTPGPRSAAAILLLQSGLVLAPMAVLGETWIGMPGFLAGTLLLYVPHLWGWLGFGSVVLVSGLIEAAFQPAPAAIAYVTVSTCLTGLVSWGLTRLTHALHQLDDAHRELSATALVEERLRLARDVHDILGSGLSAVILKTELAHRLLHRDSAAADVELAETLAIARRALDDVRTVADGFADLTLHDELRLARSVLESAGVATTIETPEELDLSAEASSTLGTGIREAATNALRHASPGRCHIAVTADGDLIRLAVVNDGVPASSTTTSTRVGQGLRNLTARFTAIGGDFRAGPSERGRFEVHAELPRCPGAAPGGALTAVDVAAAAPRAVVRAAKPAGAAPDPRT